MGLILAEGSVVMVGIVSSGSFCWLRKLVGRGSCVYIGTYFFTCGCTRSERSRGLGLTLSLEVPTW